MVLRVKNIEVFLFYIEMSMMILYRDSTDIVQVGQYWVFVTGKERYSSWFLNEGYGEYWIQNVHHQHWTYQYKKNDISPPSTTHNDDYEKVQIAVTKQKFR